MHGGRLKIRLAARAVDGAANLALVEFLAGALDAAKRNVRIEAGAHTRQKRVSVSGPARSPEDLLSA